MGCFERIMLEKERKEKVQFVKDQVRKKVLESPVKDLVSNIYDSDEPEEVHKRSEEILEEADIPIIK